MAYDVSNLILVSYLTDEAEYKLYVNDICHFGFLLLNLFYTYISLVSDGLA